MTKTTTIDLELQIAEGLESTSVPSIAEFTYWISAALPSTQATICIRIIDEHESNRMNIAFRNKAGATNILSFTHEEKPLHGDLALCLPIVLAEATQAKLAPLAHWAHLTVHGCLHLQGYDHQTDAQADVMMPLESQLMQQLGFNDPYHQEI